MGYNDQNIDGIKNNMRNKESYSQWSQMRSYSNQPIYKQYRHNTEEPFYDIDDRFLKTQNTFRKTHNNFDNLYPH